VLNKNLVGVKSRNRKKYLDEIKNILEKVIFICLGGTVLGLIYGAMMLSFKEKKFHRKF